MNPPRCGGKLLADQLVLHGCELAFCVPGESYLPLLDGLFDHRDRLRVVTCRHESAGANAAEAAGKLTGRPGVCLVTRGPGATHAAVGVHTARQDSTPMLLLVGQVARAHRGREAFQEIDCRAVFGSLAKAVLDVDDVDRIPELVARGFTLAASGRPGPVVLSLPEDVLYEQTDVPDALPFTAHEPVASPDELSALASLLAASDRPLVLVGGGPWDVAACQRIGEWCQECGLPVAAAFRRQDIVDNTLPCYVGDVGLASNPALLRRFQRADLVVAVGARLTEVETQGYSLLSSPRSSQTLVHVYPDPGELGRVFSPRLAIVSSVRAFARALSASARVDGRRWEGWSREARAEYEAWSQPRPGPAASPAAVDLGEVVRAMRAELPDDAIVCNGAGNFTIWLHRFFSYRTWGTQLAPQSGAMGYGVPASLAAALVAPGTTVVAFVGDGDFQMAGQELATIAQERLPVIVIVVNNGTLGTIQMHQERRFPGRPIATTLHNPDFVALAEAYGWRAQRVERSEEFPAALRWAMDAGVPALIELRADAQVLTPS